MSGPSDYVDVVINDDDTGEHDNDTGEHDNDNGSRDDNSDNYSADDSSGSDHDYGAFSTLDHDSA
jgi:hypothetical protein